MIIGNLVSRILRPNLDAMKAKWDVDGLIRALDHGDYRIRKGAAEALGEMKAIQAVDALVRALKDENSDVRRAAAQALGGIGDDRAVGALVEALRDESIDVRMEAARALKKLSFRRVGELPLLVSRHLNIPMKKALKVVEGLKEGKFDFLK